MHQYQLQRYQGMRSRYHCPACRHRRKTFTLYIDTQTGEPLNPAVGKCDRLDKCGYHYTPKQWFAENGLSVVGYQLPVVRQKPKTDNRELKTDTIPYNLFKRSLSHYHQNNFVHHLTRLFGVAVAEGLIKRYCIGTAKHWPGAVVFWQIDIKGNIRTGKIMLYNAASGKRVKQPFNHINWVHSVLKLKDYHLRQCFFGEHLLNHNNLPVAIVESEKTAIIASAYYPAFIWIAAGSLTNINTQTCAVLKGRRVFLVPDLNGFELWSAKAKQLKGIAHVTVSNLLELKATPLQKQQGLDIADYLTAASH